MVSPSYSIRIFPFFHPVSLTDKQQASHPIGPLLPGHPIEASLSPLWVTYDIQILRFFQRNYKQREGAAHNALICIDLPA